MIGVVVFLFWCGFLCLCGFDSIGKQREKNKLREEAKRKGQTTYWFDGKMFHTLTNKRCYMLTDNNGDALIRDAKNGDVICNLSEINRQAKKEEWERIKRQEENIKKYEQLSDEDKAKIRTKSAETYKQNRFKELESQAKSAKSIFQATVFIGIIGIFMIFMMELQSGFDSFGIKLLVGIIIFEFLCCIPTFSQMKKAKKKYEEELQ